MAIIEMKTVLAYVSLLFYPRIGLTVSLILWYLRSLINNFVFEPAYEGQVPQPTAAITMSKLDFFAGELAGC